MMDITQAVEDGAKSMWEELHDQRWNDAEEDARRTYRIEAEAAIRGALPHLKVRYEQALRSDERRRVLEECAKWCDAEASSWGMLKKDVEPRIREDENRRHATHLRALAFMAGGV